VAAAAGCRGSGGFRGCCLVARNAWPPKSKQVTKCPIDSGKAHMHEASQAGASPGRRADKPRVWHLANVGQGSAAVGGDPAVPAAQQGGMRGGEGGQLSSRDATPADPARLMAKAAQGRDPALLFCCLLVVHTACIAAAGIERRPVGGVAQEEVVPAGRLYKMDLLFDVSSRPHHIAYRPVHTEPQHG
jgi:hypothetical protein